MDGGGGGGYVNRTSLSSSPPSSSRGFECLFRRKRVDSADSKRGSSQLARRLSVFDLVAIGVGSTIGAGVYILVGGVAREHTGPALTFSFLIAGTAAALSAFCYAELACRCPSAGSAYHYTYICVGEGAAWLIGWSLILEFTLGGAAVARGISPNLALFFGGKDKLPAFLSHQSIHGIIVDPGAAILVCIITCLLCTGIKESSLVQSIITSTNVGVMLFICIAGGYLGFKTGWIGYELPDGYFPFGVNGLLAGSATLFFSFVGFDCLTSTAEEVKSPQRDLPLGIAISLFMCAMLYMLVSAVIVGLVPYYALDPDTPISSAFASYGMEWAVYIITTGAVTALCASLMGSILPQPRILMAMARDGLLPSLFADINKHTRVPVKSTIVTGVFIAILAFFMNVSQLAGMVSVGTLLAFTVVAISVLVIRYIPPLEVPLSSTIEQSVDSVPFQFGSDTQETDGENIIQAVDTCNFLGQSFHSIRERTVKNPLLQHDTIQDSLKERRRRKTVSWSIAFICIGIFLLVSAASATGHLRIPRLIFCGVGGLLLSGGLFVLTLTDEADTKHSFGSSGGFICPFVPYLPAVCILVNTYLLINLGVGTWIRVSVWLVIGALIYVFYGRSHSRLLEFVQMAVATKNIVADLNKGEKLNGDNFDMWHRRIQYILEEQECLETLHHTMKEPEQGNTPQHQRDLEAFLAWKRKNSTARITMLSGMQDDLMVEFEEFKTAQGLWIALKKKFGVTSTTKLRQLTVKFDTYVKKQHHSMRQHLGHMATMITELKSAGHVLTEEQQVQAVIRSLPQSWEHMKVNMTHNSDITNFDKARHHVLLEEERLEAAKSCQTFVAESSANRASTSKPRKNKKFFKKATQEFKKAQTFHRRRGKRGGLKKDKSNQSCYNCGKLGHYARECTEPKQEPRTM